MSGEATSPAHWTSPTELSPTEVAASPAAVTLVPPVPSPPPPATHASLADVLERTLSTGVALRAEVVLSIAGIDLVELDLRAVLVASATRLRREGTLQ